MDSSFAKKSFTSTRWRSRHRYSATFPEAGVNHAVCGSDARTPVKMHSESFKFYLFLDHLLIRILTLEMDLKVKLQFKAVTNLDFRAVEASRCLSGDVGAAVQSQTLDV